MTAWTTSRRTALVAAAVIGAVVVGVAIGTIAAIRAPERALASPSSSVSAELPTLAPSAASATLTPTVSASPEGSKPPVPTNSPAPTSSPPPTGPANLDWTTSAQVDDSMVTTPVALETSWLLVGSAGRRAAVWTSEDATSWRAEGPIDPPPVDDPGGWSVAGWHLNAVVAYAGRFIGLGLEHVGPSDGSQIALWSSADGHTWTHVPSRGSTIDTYEIPVDAVIAPDGTLIVATQGGLSTSSSIWTTDDGETWEKHFFSTEGDGVRIDAMATSGDTLMAVGMGPGVWTSTDGRMWTPHPRPSGAGEWLTDVAYDPTSGRFVVVGTRADGRAGVWFTRDGRSWSSAAISDGPGATNFVSVGGTVIAIGGSLGTGTDADATVWTSHDGVTWRYLTLAENASVQGLDTASDATTVVTLWRWDEEGWLGVTETWTGRLSIDP